MWKLEAVARPLKIVRRGNVDDQREPSACPMTPVLHGSAPPLINRGGHDQIPILARGIERMRTRGRQPFPMVCVPNPILMLENLRHDVFSVVGS